MTLTRAQPAGHAVRMKTRCLAAVVSVLLLSVSAGAARSPAGPVVLELTGKRIQCRVTRAQNFKNGKVESSLDPARAVVRTCNQHGGKDYDGAMCFVVHTLTPEGKESALGFGCIPLNDRMVRHFDGRSLRLYRSEYHEAIDIDFTTGSGRTSYEVSLCDWGRCTLVSGEADFVDCRVLDEPAVSCVGLKD